MEEHRYGSKVVTLTMQEILAAFKLDDGQYRYTRPVICVSHNTVNDYLEIHLEKINP